MERPQLLTKRDIQIDLHNTLLRDLIACELDIQQMEKHSLIQQLPRDVESNLVNFKGKAEALRAMLLELEKELKKITVDDDKGGSN